MKRSFKEWNWQEEHTKLLELLDNEHGQNILWQSENDSSIEHDFDNCEICKLIKLG
jgi:hypothetical protein